jgi:tyrosine-protein kinase Etk/Wzc
MTPSHFDDIEDSINIFDYFVLILKNKMIIFLSTFLCAAVCAIATFFMTPLYKAEVRFVPPQQQGASLGTQLLGQLSAGGGAGALMGGMKGSSDFYIGVIKSRLVSERIIEHFKLKKVFGVNTMVEAKTALLSCVTAVSEKGNIISIEVVNKDPKLASDIANQYILEMARFNQLFLTSEAAQRRLFFELRLKKIKEDLIDAEKMVKRFEENTGFIKAEEQISQVLGSLGALAIEIRSKEVELNVLKTFTKPQNIERQLLEEKIKALKQAYQKLSRSDKNFDAGEVKAGPAFPKLKLDYIRAQRELKHQEQMYKVIWDQYEMAQLDESKEAPILQVIDPAVIPEKRFYPRKTFITLLGAIVGFLGAIVFIFVREYFLKIKSKPEYSQLMDTLQFSVPWKKQRSSSDDTISG